MRIAIGSDHGGFELKQHLIKFLQSKSHEVLDVGCFSTESVDYPDFAVKVTEQVSSGKTEIGIMIDGAGIGSAMAANKLPGIRAAVCNDEYAARNAREHNAANIMTIGSMIVGPGKAQTIADLFVGSEFQGGRHQKRVDKIMALESFPANSPIQAAAVSPGGNQNIQDIIQSVIHSVMEKQTPQSSADALPSQAEDVRPDRKQVITEDLIRSAVKSGKKSIAVPAGSIVTPLARDYARDHHLAIEFQ